MLVKDSSYFLNKFLELEKRPSEPGLPMKVRLGVIQALLDLVSLVGGV